MGTKGLQQPHSKQYLNEAFYKNTILFQQIDGILYVRGEQLKRMCSLLNISCDGEVMGLDQGTCFLYFKELARKGIPVGYSLGGDKNTNIIHMLKKTSPRSKTKIESTTIGITPERLV